MKYDNWGHVYGLIFNEFKYENFIKSLIDSKNKKDIYLLDNKENEVLFIASYLENTDGYCFLIGRTNEEVSKTKIDTKTFKVQNIHFEKDEHISDYTHIYISKQAISSTGNSYYLLLEKNQRIQIGSIKKLISHIIGYKQIEDKEKSKLYVGAIMQNDYIKKLTENEITGKGIIINEKKANIFDFPDNEPEETLTTLSQVSKFKKTSSFLNNLNHLINNPKLREHKEIFLIVDDGKTKNKKIPFSNDFTKYVPFYQLPYYIKSLNKEIHKEIVDVFIHIVKTGEYEII
jgi:hypothetical protein